MTQALWKQVEAIFTNALDLPEDKRGAWVAAATEGRPELRAQVQSLLEAHARAGQFLDTPLPAGLAAWIGRRLGPYRILEQIGRGGMGAVFRAEREDQFRKQVAIKIIGTGIINAAMLRRFLDERQILAGLEHPNIARLLDGGATEEGMPYMVMEYVQGVPVTQYCERHAMGARDRLELFQTVCLAVHHAHQHLVVHRDIKPANILVTPGGVPVLLDFGIARILDPLTATTAETRALLQPLTPDYASPEQLRGEPVTTATDVYSLGVLLYELLTGRRPYSLAQATLAEAIRIISENAPAKPETGDEDLDNILIKAIRREPQERYASARDVAEDIARYLQGLPVLARHGSFGYVARKTIARHKIAFASAAAALILIAAGVGAVGWEAHIANQERARAQKRFDELRGLARSVIFELHDGIAQLPGSTEVRRTLVTRALAYLDSLARDSAGDAGLQTELAAAYRRVGDVQGKWSAPNLGDTQGALTSYRKGLEIVGRALANGPRQSRLLAQAAWLNLSIGEIYIGTRNVPESRKYVSRGLDLMRAAPHSESDMASALLDMFLATRLMDPAAARRYLDQAAQAYEAALAEQPEAPGRQQNVALAQRYLASYDTYRDPASALRHLERSLQLDELRKKADPLNAGASLDVSTDLLEIGHIQMNANRPQAALGNYRRALALRQSLAAADPKNVLGRTRLAFAELAMARALFDCGDTAAGLASARASMAIFTDVTAANPADERSWYWLAEGYARIGAGEMRLGHIQQACAAYQRGMQAYAIVMKTRSPDDSMKIWKRMIDTGLAGCPNRSLH